MEPFIGTPLMIVMSTGQQSQSLPRLIRLQTNCTAGILRFDAKRLFIRRGIVKLPGLPLKEAKGVNVGL